MHPARDRRSSGGRGPALCTDPPPIPSFSRICGEVDEVDAEFLTRRLDHTWFPYLFLNATYLDIRQGGRVLGAGPLVNRVARA